MAKKKEHRKPSDHQVIDIEKVRAEQKKKKTVKATKGAQKNKKLRVLFLIIFLAILAAGSVITYSLVSLHFAMEEAQAHLNSLQKEKAALEDELKRVNDPKYIEQKARDELQMIMPGETLYVIEEDKDDKASGESSQ